VFYVLNSSNASADTGLIRGFRVSNLLGETLESETMVVLVEVCARFDLSGEETLTERRIGDDRDSEIFGCSDDLRNRTGKASTRLGLGAREQLVKHPLTFLRFFLVGPRADLDFYSRDGVYLSFRVYMGETHLVRTKEQTYRISFPERLGTTLR
jgi:hypothetical protein